MANLPSDQFWPASLAHLGRPPVAETDEEITVAEITSERSNGYAGVKLLYTALVPQPDIGRALKTPGGIGHGVKCNGPGGSVCADGSYYSPFWIDGPSGERYEALVKSWDSHNKTVLLPDAKFLMCYGLTPDAHKDGSTSWHDLTRPVYDVVRVIPVSTYAFDTGHTTARVAVRRDYLEDYLSLTGRAAVATYFEERFSTDDPEIEAILGKVHSVTFELPGRQLWFYRSQNPNGNQLSQVWGSSLLLSPSGRPISEEQEVELYWPDLKKSLKGTIAHELKLWMEEVYVSDEVLVRYQQQPEFEIHPESGSVGYGHQWSVGYCQRDARNNIRLELRKLYEGAPVDVIKHFNKFVITEDFAGRDRAKYGNRHVGTRAREVVYAFLDLTDLLERLGAKAGLFFDQAAVGRLTRAEVTYSGWWTFAGLKSLGHVIPLTLSFADFIDRCSELFKLLENLQAAPLRRLLVRLSLPKDAINDFGTLRLLATICQLASIARKEGFDLVADSSNVCKTWDANLRIDVFEPLFALNKLRVAASHVHSSSTSTKTNEALRVFGIDETQFMAGWGQALDSIYDRLTESLNDVRELIAGAIE